MEEELSKNLTTLMNENPKGFLAEELGKRYQDRFKQTLDLDHYKCFCYTEFCLIQPYMFKVRRTARGEHYILPWVICNDIEEDIDVEKPLHYHIDHIREQPLNPFTRVGTEFEVSVQEFYSPTSFFVHLCGEGSLPLLEETRFEMDKLYDKFAIQERYRIPSNKCVSGRYCSVQYDRRWYRGIVLSVKEDTQEAMIFYLDIGRISYHALSDLFYLDMRFGHLPSQAIKAQLHGIIPREGKTWSGEALLEIRRRIPYEAKVRAVVKGIRVTMHPIPKCVLSLHISVKIHGEEAWLHEHLAQKSLACFDPEADKVGMIKVTFDDANATCMETRTRNRPISFEPLRVPARVTLLGKCFNPHFPPVQGPEVGWCEGRKGMKKERNCRKDAKVNNVGKESVKNLLKLGRPLLKKTTILHAGNDQKYEFVIVGVIGYAFISSSNLSNIFPKMRGMDLIGRVCQTKGLQFEVIDLDVEKDEELVKEISEFGGAKVGLYRLTDLPKILQELRMGNVPDEKTMESARELVKNFDPFNINNWNN